MHTNSGDFMINSIWNSTVNLPSFEPLKRNLKTDVLIIGGGLTGILLAYKLKELGVQYALVEADKICSGVTLNTTAKITSQHGLIYSKISKRPILAIEVDGFHYHKEGTEQAERDKKKNEALKHMGIPLWRLNSKDAITAEDFENYIDNNMFRCYTIYYMHNLILIFLLHQRNNYLCLYLM